MTSDVSVRAAVHADLPVIAAFARQLVEQHHAVDPDRFFLPEHVEQGYRAWLGRELQRAGAVVLVAALGEELVGYAYATLEGRDWNALLDTHGAIQDVFVDQKFRRAGFGRRLVQSVVSELERRGAARVVLHTMVKNEAAQRVFAACGFRPTMLEMTR